MSVRRPISPAEVFREALESGDFASAQTALEWYVAAFRPGSLADVSAARSFIESGLAAAVRKRAALAGETARLAQMRAGYRPARAIRTWHLQG